MGSTNPTIVLISGGNAGIGEAVATQLSSKNGYHVIIGSRNAAAGQTVADKLVSEGHQASSVQLDITSDKSIEAAVAWIENKFGVLDVLINNAGILIDYVPGLTDESKDLSTRDLFTKTMNTNIIGAACLTEACLPLIRKAESPRVIFVSSIMGSLAMSTNKDTMWYKIDYKAYDCSKAAVNMLAINYARILDDKSAMVNTVCPGLIKSQLTKFAMGDEPEMGARRIVELATAAKGGPTATFSNAEGVVPW